MASNLYLTNVSSTRSSTSFGGTPNYLKLNIDVRGSGVVSFTRATLTGLTTNAATGTTAQAWNIGSAYTFVAGTDNWGTTTITVWITEPLNAATFSSASFTGNLRGLESSAMANYGMGMSMYIVAAGNGATTEISGNGVIDTSELGTSEAVRAPTYSGVSPTLNQGDMIALVPWTGSAGGTSASGFTYSCFYNGTTAAASGDSYVTSSVTLSEATAYQPRNAAINHQDPGVLMERQEWERKRNLWRPRRPKLWKPELWLPGPAVA